MGTKSCNCVKHLPCKLVSTRESAWFLVLKKATHKKTACKCSQIFTWLLFTLYKQTIIVFGWCTRSLQKTGVCLRFPRISVALLPTGLCNGIQCTSLLRFLWSYSPTLNLSLKLQVYTEGENKIQIYLFHCIKSNVTVNI